MDAAVDIAANAPHGAGPSNDVSALALDLIRADHQAQPRDHLDTEITKDYSEAMRNGATFPPLTVFYDGEIHWLADGFHRHYAAQGAGLKTLRCEVHAGGLREAILHSCGANAAHGHRRSNDDKRRAVSRMLNDEEWRQWSDREVARRCHVSDHLVAAVRTEMQPPISVTANSRSDNSERTYTTKHGTNSRMDTSAIGKTNGSSSARKGPRLNIPEGVKPSDLIRRGIDLEVEGTSPEDAAKEIRIGVYSYRQARDIVLLADRDDLAPKDAAVARRALTDFDEAQQVSAAHALIETIVAKVWGGKRSPRNSDREANRVAAFDNAIGVIVEACERGAEIDIPHLSKEQSDLALQELQRAEQGLRKLKSNIKDTRQ